MPLKENETVEDKQIFIYQMDKHLETEGYL